MATTATPNVTELAPGEQDVIVRQGTHGSRQAVRSVWGLILPGTGHSGAGALSNARAESLLVTPAFRQLIPRRRCIVPATAFQEVTGRGKDRRVLAIRRADGRPMALAGLWTSWRDPRTGAEHLSHVVITTSANTLMAQFKHRVPVVLLDRMAIDHWLDPAVTNPAQVLPLLQPAPDDLLVATPLAPAAGSGQCDDSQLALPLDGA